MTEALDLLAIGAHPDDAEMTSGGWICLAGQQGYRTGVLHLTKGEMGTHGTSEERVAEATEAARIMGCSVIEFAGMLDGRVSDDFDSVALVVNLLRKLKPKVVLAPNERCHHPDHESAARLVRKAVHFASLNGYESDLSAHRVQRLVTSRYSQHFEPSFYVDVSSVIEQKKQAILAYKSQFQTVMVEDGKPLTRMSKDGFIDQFLSITGMFGLKCGCRHAEAYRVESAPLLLDPIKTLSEGPAQHLIR
ncbi:MAG: bacillithiol biosynthesis deacetylase BshB1 [Planctomycetes bacterium]|nr:bacillithiol biosynthesis deacetylase BshB1 [Planctomycetota bacterium]MCA8936262.1 bacillithiol biosynthesis deacetylase BshB1 [Planctomycetota bacterium]